MKEQVHGLGCEAHARARACVWRVKAKTVSYIFQGDTELKEQCHEICRLRFFPETTPLYWFQIRRLM
jgi:hypothetical protein